MGGKCSTVQWLHARYALYSGCMRGMHCTVVACAACKGQPGVTPCLSEPWQAEQHDLYIYMYAA